MRIPAVNQNPQPKRSATAAEMLRLLVPARTPVPPAEPAPKRVDEVPADLDQRVRLVGEW